ncbi:MAG: putative transporter permease/ATP-binding protein [Rhodococcus erythropolis]|uniref:Multidrug ABC transporter ATP-binding protein n=1 Tax=Rhodococcus erythropolis TaxID=1833 RepID=A0A401N070_RHOER|nr:MULTISPECIES: ABC transporter ATP-binding protein [Rhodococcus]NRH30676.1 ABC transporter ATP-binding protein [Rhodococcus sp. MS13]KAB2582916.1 multidrug ABC transporter ATP-binding protein [Rhodococcus erythropolis]MBO8146532.1 ABC transporter ATP-binding protein [Rhodococcus erythropolis]MCQ4124941.1 ABC transporter ATP-binding protein/permease [Rhodococcus erythropolis]MDF2893729.1 putative transporter permease/ATP-binding protein [Rhodococcus erythropolis]
MTDTLPDASAVPATSALPIASTTQTVRALIALLRPRGRALALTTVVLLSATACGLSTPALLGLMVDAVTEGKPFVSLLRITAFMLGAAAAGVALTWWSTQLLANVAQNVLADLREDVFAATLAQPSSLVEDAGTGDLISRVSGDVEAVNTVIARVLPATVSALFMISLTLVGVGVIDWRFTVAIVAVAPIHYFALRHFLRRSGPVYRRSRAAQARRGQQLIETLGGAGTVTALRRTDEHIGRIAETSEHAISFDMQAVRLRTNFFAQLNGAELLGLAAVLSVGYWLVTTGSVSIGAATAAALYFHSLFSPIAVFLSNIDELQDAGASLARLIGVTAMPGRPASIPASARSAPIGVDVERVSYSYDNSTPVIDSISISIAPGERIAVVGSSGAGKTTLAKLIAGIIPVGDGRITVDGTPIDDLSDAELRHKVVLVSQEVHVFVGTIADDLRLCAPDSDDAKIAEAVETMKAQWIHELPDGLETRVGAGGYQLTAAQAQHIALVRLALLDPPVVILDEATAEAGTTAAGLLDQAAELAVTGRTAVVIAHRLSQAVRADRILVMSGGRVVESGTHDELIGADGSYAALWEAWSVRS